MSRGLLAGLVLGSVLSLPMASQGQQQQPPLPWGDAEARGAHEALVVARLGLPDPRVERWSARRASSRRRGLARAREALHRYVDDALARHGATPMAAQAIHDAIDEAIDNERAQIRIRPLVDGSAVVQVRIDAEALRSAATLENVPWS